MTENLIYMSREDVGDQDKLRNAMCYNPNLKYEFDKKSQPITFSSPGSKSTTPSTIILNYNVSNSV